MKVQNSNLLMTVAGIDLNETEMESIVGGVITSGQISLFLKYLETYQNDKNMAINLITKTFSKPLWNNPAEKIRQDIEFTNFENQYNNRKEEKSKWKSAWLKYNNEKFFQSGTGLELAKKLNTFFQ